MESIGKRIKNARNLVGLSQSALASAIGIAQPSLSQIEGDLTKPERVTLIALAKALNNDFGESWLAKHLSGNQAVPSKREIIKETSPEEYLSLRSDGETTERQRAEAMKLLKAAQKKLKQMED